eukprot:COSAG04_NODE_454_length_14092_cov_330.378261_6_plen_71_part_00
MGGTVDGDREAGLPPLTWPLRHAGAPSRPDLNTHSRKVRFDSSIDDSSRCDKKLVYLCGAVSGTVTQCGG